MQKTEAATKRAKSVDDDGDMASGVRKDNNLAEGCQEILALNMGSTAILDVWAKATSTKCIEPQEK